MNSLMRLMFPWMLCFAEGGGAAGGDGDGGASGAGKTTPDPAAGGKSGDADTITIPKKDFERLNGRLGQLEDAERRRADEKKKADEEELKKRGDHEKLIDTLKQTNSTHEQTIGELQQEMQEQWDELSASLPKDDKRLEGVFKVAKDGEKLSVTDLRANMAEYRKLKRLGVFEGTQPAGRGAPGAGKPPVKPVTPSAGQPQRPSKYD